MAERRIKRFTTILLLFLLPLVSCLQEDKEEFSFYYTPETLEVFLVNMTRDYPSITSLEVIGHSRSGRPLYALVVSGNPGVLEREPRIRLVGAIHGDEIITTQWLALFIEYLLKNYETDSRIQSLVDGRCFVFIPMLNPDGVARGWRYNAGIVDLNRNFDEHWTLDYDHGTGPFSEPETAALRDYSVGEMRFHLSLSYHAGSVVVNMPFDYGRESEGIYPAEQTMVEYFARAYATSGGFLQTPGLMRGYYVDQGTINGGDWYVITGSLQDWSYMKSGCLDYTVEMSRGNPGTPEEMRQYFLYNRDALLAYAEEAGRGLCGRVTESGTGLPMAGVRISVPGGDLAVYTDSEGYYHRLLLPGSYDITFQKSGYSDKTLTGVTIPDSKVPVVRDVQM